MILLSGSRSCATRIYTPELADIVVVNPYCRISDLVSTGVAQPQAACTYLKTLLGTGLLEEVKTKAWRSLQ